MDTHQGGLCAFQIAAHQRNMLVVIDIAGVGDHAEITEARGQDGLGNAADIAFVLHAVANQIRDRRHLQVVFPAKLDKLWHAGHSAVVTHDFANDTRGREAGDAGEIHGCFGLPGADEDAAIASAQRKNMAGAREILRLGLRIDGRQNGDGAVGGADSRAYADARVHRFGKRRAVNGSIDGRHEREAKLVAALFREGHADQAAAVLSHEVDGVGSDFLGGHGEVAFVFAVFVVDEDDHAALTDFFDGFFDGGEMGVVFSHKLLLLSFSPNDSTSGGGRAVTTTGSGRLVTCDWFGAQLNGGVCGYRRRVAVTPPSGLGAGTVHAGRARKAYRRVSVR